MSDTDKTLTVNLNALHLVQGKKDVDEFGDPKDTNVLAGVVDGLIVIVIDPSANLGRSGSGRTQVVAKNNWAVVAETEFGTISGTVGLYTKGV